MSITIATLITRIVELYGWIDWLIKEAVALGADPVELEIQIAEARVKREAVVAADRKDELEIFSGGS